MARDTTTKRAARAARAAGKAAGLEQSSLTQARSEGRAAAREALALDRLSPGMGVVLDALADEGWSVGQRIATRRGAQASARAAKRRAASVEGRVEAALDRCGYRQSTSSWAGGNHTNYVVVSRLSVAATGWNEEARSANGKWRGTNSYHRVTVRPHWCARVERSGIATVGGLLTLDATRVAPRVWRRQTASDQIQAVWEATWVEQGRGVSLRAQQGWIVQGGAVDGMNMFVHVVDGDLAGVLRRAARTLTMRAKALAEATDLHELQWTDDDLNVVVTLADSQGAGNCVAGTRSWVARHFPGRREATVRDVLLAARLAPASSGSYHEARLACHVAIRRARRAALGEE